MTTDISKRTILRHNKYSTYNYEHFCLNDYILKESMHNMQQFRNASEIVIIDDLYGFIGEIETFYTRQNETQYCKQQCPMACDFKEYSTTTAHALYPLVFHQEMIRKFFEIRNGTTLHNYNFTDLEKTSLAVNIFYKVNMCPNIELKFYNFYIFLTGYK